MSTLETQIKTLYETGAAPMEIAQQLDLETTVVELAIAKNNGAYRKELITQDDVALCIEAIKEVALYERENPRARVEAAKFIINEAKGRNDPKGFGEIKNINVIVVNDRIRKMKDARARALTN